MSSSRAKERCVNSLTGLAFAVAGAPLVRKVFASGADTGLTTVLYHRFFFGGEPEQAGRERLRRQLGWLRDNYEILSLDDFNKAVQARCFPKRALFITVDDAKTDLLKVCEDFKSFGVPITVYVCAGWTAQTSAIEPGGLWARAVTDIEWYDGPEFEITLGSQSRALKIGRAVRAATIDELLNSRASIEPHLEELISRVEAMNKKGGAHVICSWDELKTLQREGIAFGSHSVGHIKLAAASDVRLNFAIREAKRLIEFQLGPCTSFAYPFGVAGTFDRRTAAIIEDAGFSSAFLTHPGFAQPGDDPFHLPRFALPDRHMTGGEFRGRVRGAGVMLRRLKNAVRPSPR